MANDESAYFERLKSAIKQAIDGYLIKINQEFNSEDEFFEWLAKQNQGHKE